MEEKTLKEQAQEIIVAVDHDLHEVEVQPPAIQADVNSRANTVLETMFNVVSDVDLGAATARVSTLKANNPGTPYEELAQNLIREKCRRTGTVGAVTAGAGIIPGIGTAAAITLGAAADIGVTFKLQAELVLEIAALYDYPLNEEEKQRLVMVITGISAGTTVLARKAGQSIATRAGEKFAERAILKAIPVAGIIASAGTNVLSTYVIGQRADMYFRLGPEAVGTWADSLRAISGVDERKITHWVAGSGKATGAAIATGANKVGRAGKVAGGAVVTGAGKAAGAVGTGAKKAGDSAQRGMRAYFRRLKRIWSAIFRFIGSVFGFIWTVISFVPRKISGLFSKKQRHRASSNLTQENDATNALEENTRSR